MNSPRGHANILLLQGPLGPFFANLSDALEARGAITHKINFNGGDATFARATHVVNYYDTPENWSAFVSDYVAQNDITHVVTYGDGRFYHKEARDVCDERNIPVYGFEEGYVRPGFVTLEKGGNNVNSRLPERIDTILASSKSVPDPYITGTSFWVQGFFAMRYYYMKDSFLRPKTYRNFKGYAHHRPNNVWWEQMAWIRAARRKIVSKFTEYGLTDKLVKQHKGKLFLVPLQVALDTQVLQNSEYSSIPAFIEEVLVSFAEHASADAHVLIKHHPLDRGFNHYGDTVNQVVESLGLQGRVTYAFDVDIERILSIAAGCITINSTVGTTALEKGVPTIMMGKAIAVSAGLSSKQSLDQFWQNPQPVNQQAVSRFKEAMLKGTQIPGSFYRERNIAANHAAACLIPANLSQ